MGDHVVDDVSIHFELYGKGKPLLLLHGFTASGKQWSPFVESLQEEYLLIVPDLPGHGRSGIPRDAFTHRKAAEYIYKLLDFLQIAELSAIGFSSGAMVLLHMATLQRDRLKRVVLWSGTTFFPRQCRERMAQVRPEQITERELPCLAEHAGGRTQVDWVLHQFRSFKDSYEDMNFTPPLLSTIKCEMLIVHGDRDEYFPVEIPVNMYAAVPQAFLWIFPNATHFFREEDATVVIRGCRTFLAGGWKAG